MRSSAPEGEHLFMKAFSSGGILTAFAAVSFGIAHVIGPLTYGAEGNNVFTLLLLNNLFTLPLVMLVMFIRRIPFRCDKKALFPLLAIGVFGTAGTSLCLNMSFVLTGVGIGTMLHMIYVILAAVCDSLLLRKRIRLPLISALVLVLLGVVFMAVNDIGTDRSLGGILLSLLSGALYAFYLLSISHTAARNEDPLRVLFYTMLAAAAVFLAYTTQTGTLAVFTMTKKAWLLNIACAFFNNVLGFFLTQLGIRKIGASKAAILGALEPVSSVILGCIFLQESLSCFKLIGCACIISGILSQPVSELFQRRPHKQIKG